jgi:hypothetical protein
VAIRMEISIKWILDLLKEEIRKADVNAEKATRQSKYSIQDYWMCLEFKLQRIHDQIAKEGGFDRVPEMPYRKKLNEFRKSLLKQNDTSRENN